MTDIILAENISLTETSKATSFQMQLGGMYTLLTSKDEDAASLTRLLIGMDKPHSGKIILFGSDTAIISETDLHLIRRRIGVAFKSGGLISNLKVWENLTLPLYYHQRLSHKEIESQGIAMLGRLGYTGRYMDLPGLLAINQMKIVGIARAMLIAPQVIIYESPVYGLNQEEKIKFFENAAEFHRETPGRVSIFVSASQEVVRLLPEAVVLDLTKETNIYDS
jgi:phospholipid/cholesterol/gamma-HCH transport system ATP-binding protein